MLNKTFAKFLKSILYLNIINHLPVVSTGLFNLILSEP